MRFLGTLLRLLLIIEVADYLLRLSPSMQHRLRFSTLAMLIAHTESKWQPPMDLPQRRLVCALRAAG